MKSLLVGFLKALWRAATPIRRPIQQKVERYLNRLAAQMFNNHLAPVIAPLQGSNAELQANITQLQARITQLQGSMDQLQGGINGTAYDSNLVLNSLVREIARLQMQVEILLQYAEEASAGQQGLSLAEDEAGLPPYDGQRVHVA